MRYAIDTACACYAGKYRDANDVNFLFGNRTLEKENWGLRRAVFFREELGFGLTVAVFDGHGDPDAAYTAARYARNRMKMLEEFFIPERKFLRDTVFGMKKELAEKAGTSICGYMFNPSEVYLCNYGDSIAFRMRNGVFQQISRESGKPGQLLTGSDEALAEPYIAKGGIQKGDWYLLATNGLTRQLSNLEISEAINGSTDAQACANELIRLVRSRGGGDSIGVIACRIL